MAEVVTTRPCSYNLPLCVRVRLEDDISGKSEISTS